VLGRQGVSQIFEPEMSEEDLHGFLRSAHILQNAVSRIKPAPKRSVETAKIADASQ
jgi:hypothetical protein